MEALCFTSPHTLLQPKLHNQTLFPYKPSSQKEISAYNGNKFRPFISATLYKSTAEIASTVTSRENSSTAAVTSSILAPTPPPPQPLKRVSPDSLQYPSGYLGAVPDRTGSDGDGGGIISAMEYLTNILSSKVYDVALETPLQSASKLSERLGVHVWLKREDLQPVSLFYMFEF